MTVENSESVAVVTDSQTVQTTVPATGQTPSSPTDSAQQKTPVSALPEDVQEYIRSLQEENKTFRLKETEQQEATRLKQEEEAKKRGEWEKLATDREQEVSRLKPLETEVQTLNELLLKTYKGEYDKWPEEVKATIPKGDGVSARQMGEWLDSHRPLAEKLMQTNATKPTVRPGNTTGPNPATSGNRPAGVSDEPLVNVAARL